MWPSTLFGENIYIYLVHIYIYASETNSFQLTSGEPPVCILCIYIYIYIYTYIHVYVHLYVKYSLPPMGISASGSEAVEPSGWMPWRSCPTHGRWYACAAPQTWYVYGVYIYNTYVYTCSINICTNMVWKKKTYIWYTWCVYYIHIHIHILRVRTYVCVLFENETLYMAILVCS